MSSSSPDAMPTAAMTAAARRPPPIGRMAAAVVLALLMGLQPVTTDVYLPALPVLTRALGAPVSLAQLTMSALILAFGIAQMVWGPIADRVGRRPVLLAGLALYTAASAGCALAGSIEALVGWRIVQGAAMAAAVVCARAIVRDLYEPVAGAQVMALALTGLGFIALASPLSGGLLAHAFGWRAPLALVTTVGALSLAFIAWCLPETLVTRNPSATRPRQLLRTWAGIARHRVFIAWALLVACSYGGLFTVLASSSFVLMDVLGLSASAYGGAMALGSVCYIGGTFACRRLLARRGMVAAVRQGGWFTLAGALLALLTLVLELRSAPAVLAVYGLFAFGHGHHQPCGQAGVVGPFPRSAGAASALAGLLLALVAFAIGRWLGASIDGTVRPLLIGVAFWSLLTCTVAWTLVPRSAR